MQGAGQFILSELDVRKDAIVSQDFRGDQSRNRREDAEMIGTFDRVQLRVDRRSERGGLRRFQSRLPAGLLNPAGLELEMVLPSLAKPVNGYLELPRNCCVSPGDALRTQRKPQ
jgi:hypothetical protein